MNYPDEMKVTDSGDLIEMKRPMLALVAMLVGLAVSAAWVRVPSILRSAST